MRTARILWRIQKSLLLNWLMSLRVKTIDLLEKRRDQKMAKKKPAKKKLPEQKKPDLKNQDQPEKVEQGKVEIPKGPEKGKLPPPPPPPPEREKTKESGPGISEEEKEPAPEDQEIKKVELDLVDICSDILNEGFGMWHDYNPNVPPLDPEKRKLMDARMARLVRKWGLAKYFKDEIIFFGLLSWEITKRARIKPPPKNVKDHPGKTRQGKDTPGQTDRPI